MTPYEWLRPEQCDPPHRVTDEDRLGALVEALTDGWGVGQPALIGYHIDGRVQLISGSHRHAAARINDQRIPVKVYSCSFIQSIWGTDDWLTLLASPPTVKEPL